MRKNYTSMWNLVGIGLGILALMADRPALAASVTFQEGVANTFYPGGYNQTGDNQILTGGFENDNVGARNSVFLRLGIILN